MTRMAKHGMNQDDIRFLQGMLDQFPLAHESHLWEKMAENGYNGTKKSFQAELRKRRSKPMPAVTQDGPWSLKDSGVNGRFWIRKLGDGVILSVANERKWGFNGGYKWRVKSTRYSNVMFEGEESSVEESKKASEDKIREFATEILKSLDL